MEPYASRVRPVWFYTAEQAGSSSRGIARPQRWQLQAPSKCTHTPASTELWHCHSGMQCTSCFKMLLAWVKASHSAHLCVSCKMSLTKVEVDFYSRSLYKTTLCALVTCSAVLSCVRQCGAHYMLFATCQQHAACASSLHSKGCKQPMPKA